MSEHMEQNQQIDMKPHKKEPDIFDAFKWIYKERFFISLSMTISISLAFIYIASVKPVYESEAFFVPVDNESIQILGELDLLLERDQSYSPEDLFTLFRQNISSRYILWSYFLEQKLYSLYESDLSTSLDATVDSKLKIQEAFNDFMSDFSIRSAGKVAKHDYFSVSFKAKVSRVEVKDMLQGLINRVMKDTKMQVFEDVVAEQKARIKKLTLKIDSLRKIAKDQKSDRIAELDEAIKIARDLNLSTPPMLGAKAGIKGVSNQGMPLYYLGYQLLEAERKVLLERNSNDPFIKELRPLQEKISLLSSLKISMDEFSIINVDQIPSIGEKVWPRNILIIGIALVVGFGFGVVTRIYAQRIKDIESGY